MLMFWWTWYCVQRPTWSDNRLPKVIKSNRIQDDLIIKLIKCLLNEEYWTKVTIGQNHVLSHTGFIFEMLFRAAVNVLIVYVECVNGSAGSGVYFTPPVVKVNSNLNIRCHSFWNRFISLLYLDKISFWNRIQFIKRDQINTHCITQTQLRPFKLQQLQKLAIGI